MEVEVSSSLKLNSPSQLQPVERVLLLMVLCLEEREGLRGALKAQHRQPRGQQRHRSSAHMRRHLAAAAAAAALCIERAVGEVIVGEGRHSLAQLEAVGQPVGAHLREGDIGEIEGDIGEI